MHEALTPSPRALARLNAVLDKAQEVAGIPAQFRSHAVLNDGILSQVSPSIVALRYDARSKVSLWRNGIADMPKRAQFIARDSLVLVDMAESEFLNLLIERTTKACAELKRLGMI